MRSSLRAVLLLSALGALPAAGGDREDCAAGKNDACKRIGRLKRLGALKEDGTADLPKLAELCAEALRRAAPREGFKQVIDVCAPLYNTELQRSLDAISGLGSPEEALVATAYGAAYCKSAPAQLKGCAGKHEAGFSAQRPAETRAALAALNRHALHGSLDAGAADALADTFDGAWERLFGAVSGKKAAPEPAAPDTAGADATAQGGVGGMELPRDAVLKAPRSESGPLSPPIAKKKAASGATLNLIERNIKVNGAIALGVAANALHEGSGAILACYEEAVAAKPGLSGDVWSKLTLDADGSVAELRISAPALKAPKLEACIRRVLTKLSFGHLKGPTATVEYPIVLTSTP